MRVGCLGIILLVVGGLLLIGGIVGSVIGLGFGIVGAVINAVFSAVGAVFRALFR